MPEKYYDVIVLGRSVGALVAAALLARRDFTVLLLGQRQRPSDYQCAERTLRRDAFTMLAGQSPVWRRILGELAQTQSWKRRVAPVVPMLQILTPDQRFEVPPDGDLFRREVDRTFPEVRRLIADLYADFARVTAAADAAFDRDAVWPPGRFLERRQTGRVAATLPYARAEQHADLLADFPRDHTYRRIVHESVRFATDLGSTPPAFAVARLHGAWTRALSAMRGGAQELEQMLLERIEANGGRYMLDERADAMVVKRGVVSGVHIDGDVGNTGAGFVISDASGEELAALAGGQGISKRAQREWPRVIASVRRYVASIVVRRAGVPVALGLESLLLPGTDGAAGAGYAVHLQRFATSSADEVLLVCELLLPERSRVALRDARAYVLEQLCRALPFLERHLVLVDSVYDGLPVWRYVSGDGEVPVRVAVERSELLGPLGATEPMRRQLEIDPPGYLGLAGEPLRGPIDRALLVGPTVLPGLGLEGRLLAACGAARLVTQSDKRKARMRREMWTKIEIS